MATISIKMKVYSDTVAKQKIEKAHILFNEKVRLFEEFLLLARAKDYYYTGANGEEQYKSEEEARTDLKHFLQSRNIQKVDECMSVLSRLDNIIESKGSQVAGMLPKIYNSASTGGMNNIGKIIDPWPVWVEQFDLTSKSFSNTSYKEMADAWISSNEGQKMIAPVINGAGRPSAFKLAYTSGKEWYAPFISDQKKYREDLEDGLSRMLFDLNRLNALPLVDIDETLIINHPIWVKLMLKTALENYASYIACDKKTRDDYRSIEEDYDSAKKVVDEYYSEYFSRIEQFLKNNYVQTDRPIYLTDRMCRGLDDLKYSWKTCTNINERISVVTEWQSDRIKKKKIGDVNFLHWLAEDCNQDILEGNILDSILKYYECMRKKNSKKRCASYTVADPVDSKRYLFYEAETGTNYRKYTISVMDGKIHVKVPLLTPLPDGQYLEENIEFQLAPNTQMEKIQLLGNGMVSYTSGKRILYKNAAIPVYEEFCGKMGGADLRVATNTKGRLTGVFMSFTITAVQKYEPEWGKFSKAARVCFSRAYDGKKSKYDAILSGKTIRAISIDLGLKQFGACAVASVEYGADLTELPKVKHERMFMLRLPNENVDTFVERVRLEALKEVRQLMSEIKYLSLIKRIYRQDEEGRRKILARSVEYYKNPDKLNTLLYCLNINNPVLANKCLKDEYSMIIHIMNDKMREYRSGENTKKQSRNYKPGKSFWSIVYLEEIRKLLIAWSSLGYKIDDDNRLMEKEYGVTATGLLNHINHIKDDRIKTGADQILMAARGFRYDEEKKCWIQQYEPCNIVIFEDLSRYRFSMDRPSGENSKLMQWAHREIVEETKRQADIYGIEVYDSTDASYSSKYGFKTNTPGIRCDRLKNNDFEKDGRLKETVFERLPEKIQKKVELLKVGDLIPAEIGGLFVTLDSDGKLYTINADLNAACNLQHRFFGMHTHLVRLATSNKDGAIYIKGMNTNDVEDSTDFGKRNRGKYLLQYKTDKVMIVNGNNKHFAIVKKQKGMEAPFVGKEKVYTLFRDPSGYIFPSDEWIGSKEFWSAVESRVITEIIKSY